jgi:pyruvate-ferredoxin/flavodoxin oxidoreductase
VHTVKVLQEAESYRGPSIIIAYSHCIAHGYDLANGLDQQKLAVETGYWPLYRYDPRLKDEGKNPFQLDSAPPKGFIAQYMRNETRFRAVEREYPQRFAELSKSAQSFVTDRYARYRQLAGLPASNGNGHAKAESTATATATAAGGSPKPQAEVVRAEAAATPSSGVMNVPVSAPTAPRPAESARPLRINMTAGRGD